MDELSLIGTVVFDGRNDMSSDYPFRKKTKTLEIIFSPTNLDADNYILEFLITFNKKIKDIVVVTSDNELASKAKSLHASTLSVKEFLKLLNQKKPTTTHLDEKPNCECRFQLERLLKIFENLK